MYRGGRRARQAPLFSEAGAGHDQLPLVFSEATYTLYDAKRLRFAMKPNAVLDHLLSRSILESRRRDADPLVN